MANEDLTWPTINDKGNFHVTKKGKLYAHKAYFEGELANSYINRITYCEPTGKYSFSSYSYPWTQLQYVNNPLADSRYLVFPNYKMWNIEFNNEFLIENNNYYQPTVSQNIFAYKINSDKTTSFISKIHLNPVFKSTTSDKDIIHGTFGSLYYNKYSPPTDNLSQVSMLQELYSYIDASNFQGGCLWYIYCPPYDIHFGNPTTKAELDTMINTIAAKKTLTFSRLFSGTFSSTNFGQNFRNYTYDSYGTIGYFEDAWCPLANATADGGSTSNLSRDWIYHLNDSTLENNFVYLGLTCATGYYSYGDPYNLYVKEEYPNNSNDFGASSLPAPEYIFAIPLRNHWSWEEYPFPSAYDRMADLNFFNSGKLNYMDTNLGFTLSNDGFGIGNGYYFDNYGDVLCSNFIYNSGSVTSDAKLKKSIQPIALQPKLSNFFDNLKPATFKYNEDKNNTSHIGFIADDVRANLAQSGLDPNQWGLYTYDMPMRGGGVCQGLRYSEFVALNTAEIQKLKAKMDDLERKEAAIKEFDEAEKNSYNSKEDIQGDNTK